MNPTPVKRVKGLNLVICGALFSAVQMQEVTPTIHETPNPDRAILVSSLDPGEKARLVEKKSAYDFQRLRPVLLKPL
jgi:hypothetical protein